MSKGKSIALEIKEDHYAELNIFVEHPPCPAPSYESMSKKSSCSPCQMSIDRTMMGRILLTEGDLVSKLAECLAEQQQQQQSKDVKQQSSSSRVQLTRCMLLQLKVQ